MSLEFVDELPGRFNRIGQVAELRANPGKWARIQRCQTKMAAASAAKYFRVHFEGIEAASRGVEVYARAIEDTACGTA